MADQLCTTAQVKARVYPTGTVDVTDDSLISELIDQASDEIQHFARRKLVPEVAATYVFDTALGHILAIPRGIRTVTAMGVAATDQPDSGGTYQAVTVSPAASSLVLLRPVAAERRPGWPATELRLLSSPLDTRYPFRTAANGATITGDFGFAATPPSVVRIAVECVAAAYLDRRRSGQGGETGDLLPRYLTPDQLGALMRFRPGTGIG